MPGRPSGPSLPEARHVNRFMRVGYEFVGWTATPEWTGTVIGDGDEMSDLTTERGGKVTLYAQWNPLPYYVEFNSNGADYGPVMPEQEMLLDQSANLLRCSYTRENYHFTGWNTEADGSGDTYQPGVALERDLAQAGETITLYAQWIEDPHPDNPDNPDDSVPSDSNDPKKPDSASEKLAATGDSTAGAIGVLALASACSFAVSLHGRCRGDRR